MATYKNIKGDYEIRTLDGTDSITLTSANVVINAPLSVNGNITTTQFYFGDGRFLSNVNVSNTALSTTQIVNGTSNVSIPAVNGNVTFGVNGNGDIIVVSSSLLTVAINHTITANTPSTTESTGALTVAGGVGVAGNIRASNMFSNNQEVLNVVSVINGGTY